MSSDVAIQIRNLSKCYRIFDKPHHRLMHMFSRGKRKYYKEFWALSDVSFDIKKGETVGIIGRNGSGKSTLLQMICGTLTPTHGELTTHGRISALLELGAGFNADFTGRENVYMNGAILGLSKEEIDERFDDIAAFAEIGEFIEQPVKTYSSGMYVRLAFATAINVDPEILVVDEALSVGDMAFQAKCMSVIDQFRSNGVSILFVTHSITAIKSICDRAIYLKDGLAIQVGEVGEVSDRFVRDMREESSRYVKVQIPTAPVERDELLPASRFAAGDSPCFIMDEAFDNSVADFRYGTGEAKVTYVELLDPDDLPVKVIDFNQALRVRIHLLFIESCTVVVSYFIRDDKNLHLIGSSTRFEMGGFLKGVAGEKKIVEFKASVPLSEGDYNLQILVAAPVVGSGSAQFIDVVENVSVFQVLRKDPVRVWAKVYVPNEVSVYDVS